MTILQQLFDSLSNLMNFDIMTDPERDLVFLKTSVRQL